MYFHFNQITDTHVIFSNILYNFHKASLVFTGFVYILKTY